MKKLKKLVGDKNKSIINYFEDEAAAIAFINAHIANPKCFELHELKGIVSDCLVNEEEKIEIKQSATELLKEIGYEIIKTTSLEHLNSLKFGSWFEKGDKWCKYNSENRWSQYDIFIIWKPDAKDLKPLESAKVGDEYSLSLMSLGCLDGNVYQICQRYNHSASGSADWALGGNLNNLIPGLSEAFCQEFGYESLGESRAYMPQDTIIRNGKYVKYNYEISDIYFFDAGIATAEGFEYTDKERYTIVDYLVVDWIDKKVIDPAKTNDGLIEPLQDSLTKGTLTITKS